MKIKRSEIIEVLEELKENHGYEFETNFWCCSSCAGSAMVDKYGEDLEKYIFWHEQDDEGAFIGNVLDRKIYLRWGGNAEEIIEAFQRAGIKTEWEGTSSYCIGVLPERTSNARSEQTTEEKAIEELEEIRQTGKFNMVMQHRRVMQYANQNQMFSLVSYCKNSREEYMKILRQIG